MTLPKQFQRVSEQKAHCTRLKSGRKGSEAEIVTEIIGSERILRLVLLNGVSLWVLKSFRILAGNGVERKTVSQEPKFCLG